jgi:hypothetical protein
MACIDPRAVVAFNRHPRCYESSSEHRRNARERLARGRDPSAVFRRIDVGCEIDLVREDRAGMGLRGNGCANVREI